MATYPSLCHLCYLRDAVPRHWSPGASQPHFFLPLPHVTGTPPQLLRPREGPPLALSSTPTLGVFFCFLTSREAEDFLRGVKYFKYVPAPTYLIYLLPKDLYR